MDPITWVEVATGRSAWADAVAAGRIRASGTRADLSGFLPIRHAETDPEADRQPDRLS